MTTTMVKKPKWIEKLPNGWAFLPVRAVLKERKEKNTKLEESNILSVMKGIGVIRYEDKGNVGNKSSERPEAYKIVRKNDLVLNSMNLSIGSVGMAREDGVTSSVYIIYQARPKVANPNFYHYLFQTTSFQRHLASYGRGIMELREAVKERDIKNQPIVVPSLETQKRIAEFLDEKTEVIDELVAKKEKLIELLREKRAALITRAVTKGLDPNTKLKSSGIDWLGDVPEGWEIKKLKLVASVHASNVDKKSYEGEKNVLLCNYVDVYKNEFVDSTLLFMSATATSEQVIKLGLRVNDVLITKDSETPDDIGVPALVKETVKDLVSGYHLYLLRSLSNEVIGEYLFRFLQSRPVKGYFETRSNGVTRFGLSSYGVKNMSISIPSLPEQRQIADFLDAETTKIDKAVTLIESQIEKLKEYRSSLIYHAVTGKIKV